MTNDDEKLETYKARLNQTILWLRQDLNIWVQKHSGPPSMHDAVDAEFSTAYYNEITSALLETAIDRQIRLLGVTDALDLIKRCFDRRVVSYKRTLQ